MSESWRSAVDMLLAQHQSSLITARTSMSSAPVPAPPSRTTRHNNHDSVAENGNVDTSGAGGAAAPKAGSLGERGSEGRGKSGVRGEREAPLLHRPLSPSILPAREAQQVEIVRHEEVDLYDTLKFRLRTNDRDLQAILSRSTERLAMSERQSTPPPKPIPTHPVAPLMSRATTPPVPTALAAASLQVTPVAAPNSGAAGAAEREVGVSARPNLSIAVNPSAETTPTNVAATRYPEALPADGAVFRDGRKREDSQRQVLPPNRGGGSNGSVNTFHPSSSARMGPGNIVDGDLGTVAAAAAIEPAAAEDDEEVAAVEAQLAAHFGVNANSGRQQRPLRGANASPGGGMSLPAAQVATPRCEAGESGGKDTGGGGGAFTPQRATRERSCHNAGGVQGPGVRAGVSSADFSGRPPRGKNSGDVGGGSATRDLGTASSTGVATAASAAGQTGEVRNIDFMLGTPPRLPRPLADGIVVGACKEAARWLAVDDRTWHQAKKFMDDCIADCPSERILNRRKLTPEEWRQSKVAAIEAALRADPSLATSRYVNRAALPMDGWTPLHAAAARGNLDFVKALLKVPGVSVWSVDLQGRTALALAAEGGHLELCLFLKERMEAESADTVVGINAPIDLAGRTPVAWSVRSRSRNKQVEGHLYAVGDASVCPATPAALRSGGVKTAKGGTCRTGAGNAAAESVGEGLPCGYSEAPGWRIEMEDAVCIHNPIPLDPEAREAPPPDPTSMFGIFDGHGGAFTSKFVAGALVGCLQATSGWKSGNRDLRQLCPAITEAFQSCDALLAKEPRMVVTEHENPSDGKQFEARDGSGSTAVVGFITRKHVIVANAGDSRAVLITVAPPNKRSETSGGKDRGVEEVKGDMAPSLGGGDADGAGGRNPCFRLEDAVTSETEAVVGEMEEKHEEPDGVDKVVAGVGAMGLRDDTSGFEGDDRRTDDAGGGVRCGGARRGGSSGGRANPAGGGRVVDVTDMSRDHTAKDEGEKERVTAAGGKTFEVTFKNDDGTESNVVRTAYNDKVQGQSVMPTRGFGDFYYKQKKDADGNLLPPVKQVVTVCPEFFVHERGSSDQQELLLMACDGVWDVFSSKDAGGLLVSRLEVPLEEVTGEALAIACDALVDECLRRGSTDNITAVAISLGSGPPPSPSAVGGRVLFKSDGQ